MGMLQDFLDACESSEEPTLSGVYEILAVFDRGLISRDEARRLLKIEEPTTGPA